MVQSLHERLKAARMAAGYAKAIHAAHNFGWNISTYRAHENGQNPFDLATAQLYAKSFGVSLAWLFTGEGASSKKTARLDKLTETNVLQIQPELPHPNSIKVRGVVGEGVWISKDNLDSFDKFSINPLPAITRYPANKQFDLKVLGHQALPYARNGEIIRCVEVEQSELKINDIIVVQTQKLDLIERKIRRILDHTDQFTLANFEISTDCELCNPGDTIKGETISFIGKIILKYEFAE